MGSITSNHFTFHLNLCIWCLLLSFLSIKHFKLIRCVKFDLLCRLPWNQRSLLGWFYETIFSVVSSSLYLHTNVVFLTFFIAICEFHRAFLSYFVITMQKNQNMNDKNRIKRLLCDVIQYHISTKKYARGKGILMPKFLTARKYLCNLFFQINLGFNSCFSFFWDTSDVYSLILLTQLICIVLHMTCSVFQMDMVIISIDYNQHWNECKREIWYAHFILLNQAIKHLDLNSYMVLMALLVSGANLFFYCYYGNRSTNDYAQMSHILYESNWNELPVELQKFVKMMIANAQRPLFYHGFHLVILNLETYLKVNEIVSSYVCEYIFQGVNHLLFYSSYCERL